MSEIKNVNAHSVYTFDFSTLYTDLPLIDIHDKLTKLIKKMYQNAIAHYILVNTYTGKAFWSHTGKGSYKSFSLQHLLDALEYILNNTYIKFGQQLFLQLSNGTVVPFDIWIKHLLLVDKILCANSLPLLAFYKFLHLCKQPTI